MESTERVLVALAAVLTLGVASQWLAHLLRLPSILILLLAGFAAGNLAGPEYHPDRLFGPLLFPFTSFAVAIILFEGGLTLRRSDLEEIGPTVLRLVTIGVFVTGLLAAAGARFLAGLPWGVAAVVGAICTVTGPTVVGPLLRFIRPHGRVGAVLHWEGILVDPVGAVLALLVLEAVRIGSLQAAPASIPVGLVLTLVVGALLGIGGAALLYVSFARDLVPDSIQNALTLAVVALVTVVADEILPESGLLAATVMGALLANQRRFAVRHIVEFKENLRVLLIGTLFVTLAARVEADPATLLSGGVLAFAAFLVLVVRPAAAFLSLLGSPLDGRERILAAWLAPRGIVAAAVASLFALRLGEEGVAGAERIVPVVFTIIVATVAVYGLTAAPLARALGLAERNPQGLLVLGVGPFSLEFSRAVGSLGYRVLLVDQNPRKTLRARLSGLETWCGNILSEHAIEELRLGGLGKFFALTRNDEANALACHHLQEVFSRSDLYQIPPELDDGEWSRELVGRLLFRRDATIRTLDARVEAGWIVKATRISERFPIERLRSLTGDEAIPLLVRSPGGELLPYTVDEEPPVPDGAQVLTLSPPFETTDPAAPKEGSERKRTEHAPGGRS